MTLINELDEVFKKFSKSEMAEYLDVTLDATNKWRVRKNIPYDKLKGIVEFMEMHTDDCVTLCQHIMEEYNLKKQNKK